MKPVVCPECGSRFPDEDTGAPSTLQPAHLAEESLANHLERTTSERDDLECQLAALAGLSVWPRGARLDDYFVARSTTMADSSSPRLSNAIARHLAAYHVRDRSNYPEVWLLGVARDAWRDRTALLNEVATLRSQVGRAEAKREEAIAEGEGGHPLDRSPAPK